MPACGNPLVNYRDGTFCCIHLEYENKCGVISCLRNRIETAPACAEHLALYQQFEVRFGRDRSIFSSLRQMHRMQAIQAGDERMEWEPPAIPWDTTVQHYWQARHIKVVEIAVAACGVPLTHTKFPFDEGENNIADFMSASWPAGRPDRRPTYLVIDKGCKVMATLNARNELLPQAGGWMRTTNIKVDTWHYNGHAVDNLCVTWCNPNDEHDPNLVQAPTQYPATRRANAEGHGHRAQARRAARTADRLQRSFNTEAAEHLNAFLLPFSATLKKMKPDNHDIFLCIVLKERADNLIKNCTPLG